MSNYVERRVKCRWCGQTKAQSDMALIDDEPHCHPAWSSGQTCYMQAQQYTPYSHLGDAPPGGLT